MDSNLVQITFDIDVISTGQDVYANKCNGMIFRNSGDTDAFIGNIPLPAGSVNDDFGQLHPGQVLVNTFNVSFKQGTTGINPQVIVLRKYPDKVPVNQTCKFDRNH